MNKRFSLVGSALIAFFLALSPLKVSATSSTNSFRITNYDVKMTLGRDSEQRSVLRATETITAYFSTPNQNHGLARDFVKTYQGHTTDFTLVSVKDKWGKNLAYHWSGDELRIGDADRYVYGSETYVITYTQRDVTAYYKDTAKDEFYWDVIGSAWPVPIDKATIELTLDSNIKSAVQTDVKCYQGSTGSTATCSPVTKDGVTTVSVRNLSVAQGVTMAVGFTKGTFAAYNKPLMEQLTDIWGTIQLVAMPISVLVGFILWRANRKSTSREKEIGAIPPEYIPPADASVSVSASIMNVGIKTITPAQLIDLAVRHYVKIYEVENTASIFKSKDYQIELVKDVSDLKKEERAVIDDMFGTAATVGKRLNLSGLKNNQTYTTRVLNEPIALDKLIRDQYALREKNAMHKKRFVRYGIILFILAVVLLSPAVIIVSILSFMLSRGEVLTDKGLELRRYLEGLKMYIGAAEADRLKMLQSPEGAEKVAAAGFGDSSNANYVKLYERLLPYAMIFGQEKQWANQLGKFYEQQQAQPDWYGGGDVFNTAAFVSCVSYVNSSMAAASSFASASSSSSYGGSSGGGSVGGGGGGGGGGGW